MKKFALVRGFTLRKTSFLCLVLEKPWPEKMQQIWILLLNNTRTHNTYFRPRIDYETCTKTHNVNVSGKRGNIVQVYPAVEYDFVPNNVLATEGDCVHFQ